MSDYTDLVKAVEQYYGAGSDEWAEIAKYGIASDNAAQILKQVPGVDIWINANGSVRSYNLKVTENIASTAEQAINSNVPAEIKSFEIPSNSGIETFTSETGETVKQMTFKSGMKQAGNFVFGEVAPAICAAATGITLGKTIDSLLYNANPDFWDEKGMSALDPDTWGDIIGTDTAGERFLNMILGTTPDGKTQAYIDQNALAYMSLYEKNMGVFGSDKNAVNNTDSIPLPDGLNMPFNCYTNITNAKIVIDVGSDYITYDSFDFDKPVKSFAFYKDRPNPDFISVYYLFVSSVPFNYINAGLARAANHTTYNNKDIYYYSQWTDSKRNETLSVPNIFFNKVGNNADFNDEKWQNSTAYLALYDYAEDNITGIGKQEGAKTPDLSGATTVDEALNALQQQYPEVFADAVTQNVVQPDGSTVTYTYVPIAMPEIDQEGNPISSTSTQANPQIDPATATAPLLDVITKLLQKDTPVNPPDTGSGDSPIVVVPTGSASALYSIYNPSQVQLNSFGAWLWSSDFVDQLLKLFNDPMQAIIGLHKVFASPSISGTGPIKVGYIDSGVSSNIVGSQYTTVDCGSVSLAEYFGNVFDYEPYTKVNLYLPFIGIVPLSVGEVMRSTIHVVYHVDVLTGACLAEVKIKRDSAGGTLFQYSGNAAVQYPISSGSYMGIISGIMSIAGGVAGTIATGGAAMPVLLGAGASVGRMHTDISHSGSFSGNAGAMGIKKPYLIIDRPQTALAKNFPNYIGYPSNSTVTLSSCKGYTKVHEIHLENVPATNNELSDIEMKLKGGVII